MRARVGVEFCAAQHVLYIHSLPRAGKVHVAPSACSAVDISTFLFVIIISQTNNRMSEASGILLLKGVTNNLRVFDRDRDQILGSILAKLCTRFFGAISHLNSLMGQIALTV